MSEYIKLFNKEVEEVEVHLSITRDSELQRDAIKKTESLKSEASTEKAKAIEDKEEEYANQLLGCECVADMLIAELEMWIFLKSENPNRAWDRLIDAQDSARRAARAHDSFLHLEQQSERLLSIEKIVFPPQVFISSGLIVYEQECSICGEDYEYCPHLAGKPYMGEFCYIICREAEPDHISVVDDPADKRCRVRKFSVEGGQRDRMTWLVEPTENST